MPNIEEIQDMTGILEKVEIDKDKLLDILNYKLKLSQTEIGGDLQEIVNTIAEEKPIKIKCQT